MTIPVKCPSERSAGLGATAALSCALALPMMPTGNADIFLVNPASGDARNLTRNGAENRFPAWSPGGSQIVFVSDQKGSFNVHSLDVWSGYLHRLTAERAPTVCFLPTWGRNGLIAYARDTGGMVEILTMNPDGSAPRVVTQETDPCLSSDGRRLAFTRKLGGEYGLFVADTDSGAARELTRTNHRIGAVMPAWSPDDQELAYADQVGEALELFLGNTTTGTCKQLTHLGLVSTSPAWSPDGRQMTFRVTGKLFWQGPASAAQARREHHDLRPVWIMQSDGTAPQVVEALRYHCAISGSRAVWRPGVEGAGQSPAAGGGPRD